MITENVTNMMGVRNSLLVSKMGTITGNFKPGFNFLIKNNTTSDITASIILASDNESISTTLLPGWNPELCKAVNNAPEGLQYGL